MNQPAGVSPRKTLLVISQTFVPDPASVGQHMSDVAAEMVRRGWDVRVFTAARGYEDPTVRYPRREVWHGMKIRRLPLASFGKKNLLLRVLGAAAFMVQCLLAELYTHKVDAIFFSTSPPMVGIVVSLLRIFRRVPIAYWAMDLNPDQLIQLGKIKSTSLTAGVLETANRIILRQSALIVTLDRFMARRLLRRSDLRHKMVVMPPWPHQDAMAAADDLAAANPFRVRHGLEGKFVIMYSGNHSPSNPLRTLLDAAVTFKNDPQLCFLFVGGGSGKQEVEGTIRQHGLANMLSLPYQPLADLRYSLRAADVHVVALGDHMVGIIHPCKIYGAMAVARPILYLGPRPSHISDLLDRHGIGWQVTHGDVPGLIKVIDTIRHTPAAELRRMGKVAQDVLARNLSQHALCTRLCDALEQAFTQPGRRSGSAFLRHQLAGPGIDPAPPQPRKTP